MSPSVAQSGAESDSPTAGRSPTFNVSVTLGTLSSDPLLRELPSGDLVADLYVSTRIGSGPAHSVPVAWHRPGALAHRLSQGDSVLVIGHVAQRFFRSNGRVVSRTEVVADSVLRISQRSSCTKAIVRATSAIEDLIVEHFEKR